MLISDINECSLWRFPNGLKKKLCGLIGNFIPIKNSQYDKEYEFAFIPYSKKIKVSKEYSRHNDWRQHQKDSRITFDDYDSKFFVFRLIFLDTNYWQRKHPRFHKHRLDKATWEIKVWSNDDYDFCESFDPKHINKVMKYLKDNFKSKGFGYASLMNFLTNLDND